MHNLIMLLSLSIALFSTQVTLNAFSFQINRSFTSAYATSKQQHSLISKEINTINSNHYYRYCSHLLSKKCPYDTNNNENAEDEHHSSVLLLQTFLQNTTWISRTDLEQLISNSSITTAKETLLSLLDEKIISYVTDVTYYNTITDDNNKPSYYRMYNPKIAENLPNASKESINTPKNIDIDLLDEVIIKTYKWCNNFVQKLNLCPWVKSSLTPSKSSNIRIKLIHQNDNNHIETIIRDSSYELLQLTATDDNSDCEYSIDGNAAITFIIILPNKNDDNDNNRYYYNEEYTFEHFYNLYAYLEDKLFDEADNNIDNLGNEITIAPFHPNWTYAEKSVLDYEKKSPYPMISIVRSDVIEHAGGEDISNKISMNNEHVLCNTFNNIRELEMFYNENVLQ